MLGSSASTAPPGISQRRGMLSVAERCKRRMRGFDVAVGGEWKTREPVASSVYGMVPGWGDVVLSCGGNLVLRYSLIGTVKGFRDGWCVNEGSIVGTASRVRVAILIS